MVSIRRASLLLMHPNESPKTQDLLHRRCKDIDQADVGDEFGIIYIIKHFLYEKYFF